jgi:ferredoxin-thioredoxin reductase catalytic subunit
VTKEEPEIGNQDAAVLRKRVAEFCERSGYRLSTQADSIIFDMTKMKQLDGDFYCPCQVEKTPETVCVCEAVRNGLVGIMGACFCGLILSKE